MPVGTFTAVLHREGDFYVADCPEVGTVSASQLSLSSSRRPWAGTPGTSSNATSAKT
jgi:hypothetical protein